MFEWAREGELKTSLITYFSNIRTWPLNLTEWPWDFNREGQSDPQFSIPRKEQQFLALYLHSQHCSSWESLQIVLSFIMEEPLNKIAKKKQQLSSDG